MLPVTYLLHTCYLCYTNTSYLLSTDTILNIRSHQHSHSVAASSMTSVRRTMVNMASKSLLLYYVLACCFIVSCLGGDDAAVLEAIDICREKLEDDPHFPRVQHSLAQLLDSRIFSSTGSDVDLSLVSEVIHLYRDVGNPPDDVEEKRMPPTKVRFESLMRAAHIAKDILRDTRQAISCYMLAMHIDGIDQVSLLVAFEETIKLLLSSARVKQGASIGILGEIEAENQDQLQVSLQLCDFVGMKCPNEPLVDEFRGATLRKLKQPNLAHKSYEQAMIKSREHYLKCRNESEQSSHDKCFVRLKSFIKTSILVAAAAREVGISFDDQMSYLVAVENYAAPVLASAQEYDEEEMRIKKDDFVQEMVELYNNMGVLEKKRGSLPEAMMFFRKALDINPTDGHALVQLASISNQDDDGKIISQVKELDPEYVASLFDGYSSRFESELVDVLKYTGHELVYNSLRDALPNATAINTIIDLGCGTGLLADLIATDMPWVAIHGTDLSQRMVDISLERKTGSGGRSVYTNVSNLDASKFLSNFDEASVDCVVASDVFIYIGDLSNVLEESRKCLVEDGLIGFTVERYETTDANNGLRLLPSGRFGHSKEYVYQIAQKYGFQVLSWKDAVLRQQAGKNVDGAVVILQKQR
jgi:predicted TPR repeat methyltransferase